MTFSHEGAGGSMELRNIRAFVAAADTLHFGEAAQRLHLTQPALSRQIQKLEAELEVELFDRTGHGVTLTEAGQAFLEEAEHVLEQVERSVERARQIGRGEAGSLRIGFVSSVTFNLIPEMLRHFQVQAPEVHLELRELGTAQQVSAIRTDTLDVGLARPPLFRDEGLSSRPVRKEPIVAVLPAGHRLAEKPELDASELAAERFVMSPRHMGPGLFDRVVAICQRAGFSPNVIQEAVLVPTIVALVAGGLGVSLVPASVEPLGTPNVVYRPLRDTQAATELIVIWKTGNTNPTLETLFRCLQLDEPGAL